MGITPAAPWGPRDSICSGEYAGSTGASEYASGSANGSVASGVFLEGFCFGCWNVFDLSVGGDCSTVSAGYDMGCGGGEFVFSKEVLGSNFGFQKRKGG